jgi:DNA primase
VILYTDDPIKAEIKERLSVADVMGIRVGAATTCPFEDCPGRPKLKEKCSARSQHSWYCFICHRGGDVFSYLMARDSLTFVDAKRALAAQLGIAISPPRERSELLSKVVQAAHHYLFKVEPQKLEYLTNRALPQNILWRHQIGYLDSDGQALKASGLAREDLLRLGLVFPNHYGGPDRQALAGRYLFPIRDKWGQLVQLKGRLDPHADHDERERDSKSKPLVKQSEAARAAGWPEISHMNYLYLEDTITSARRRGELHLAEGEPDTLTFKAIGWEACGLQTCQGLYKHAGKLKGIRRIYFWPDNDVASQKFLLKELFEVLMRLEPTQTLYLCTPPALGGDGVKVDVNDLRSKYNLPVRAFEALRNGAPEAMHVLIDAWGKQLNDPATRANLYQLLRVFPPSRRSAYIGRLSTVSGKKPILLAFAVDPDDTSHESA